MLCFVFALNFAHPLSSHPTNADSCCHAVALQIQTAVMVKLNPGDTLVWHGPAGMEWGHIFFVPIGWMCVRFRTCWRRISALGLAFAAALNTIKKALTPMKRKASCQDSPGTPSAGGSAGGSGGAGSSRGGPPPSLALRQCWSEQGMCPSCGHPDHNEVECPHFRNA